MTLHPQLDQRLGKIAALRRHLADDLDGAVAAIRADIAKPRLDALGGDILFTLEQLRWYEKHARRILGSRKLPADGFGFARCEFQEVYSPLGSVLVIAPWNYPLQLALVPALSAWMAGNRVVLKPSESAPQTALYIEGLLRASGIGPDEIEVSVGGPERARELIDARPAKIFFTGSARNGREVAKRAFEMGIPVDLELGGQDAMIVLGDANIERAAAAATYGGFVNAGQVCVGVKRVWVERPAYASFLAALVKEVEALTVGFADDCDVGPLARHQEAEATDRLIADALRDGAVLQTPRNQKAPESGRLRVPVVLSGVADSSPLSRQEVFGPILLVDPVEHEEEAIARTNASPFGLAASVWSENLERAQAIAQRLIVGSSAINDVIRQIANPAAPFGGEKASGQGRYHGEAGLLTFCRRQVVMINHKKSTREIHWFPTRRKTIRQLAALIRLRHGSRRPWRNLKALVTASAMLLCLAHGAWGAALQIKVGNLKNQAGSRVAYLLFSADDGFPDRADKATRRGWIDVPAKSEQLAFEIPDLAAGQYALALYQDLNGDGILNRSWIGIPQEPVGTSNNPKGRLGPPRFSDARFVLPSSGREIEIEMVK